MKISFWGATEATTGSRHHITLNNGSTQFLLECGLFQGHRKEARELNLNFPFDTAALGGLVLSHAHIDHSGNIPNLTRQGYTGDIYCTSATLDLCNAMLRDSAYIQEKDAEYVNKHNRRKGLPEIEPLYTTPDAERALTQFHGVHYWHEFQPVDGATCVLIDAGHILGSSIVELYIKENGEKKQVVFTGDLGRKNLPILRDPEIPHDGADYLIMETTYGNRFHRPIDQTMEHLADILRPVIERGGKTIIPSFAVERTQELVYCLKVLWDEKKLPKVPVYVDSPLAVNVTEIFRLHPECFDKETREFVIEQDDPFGFDRLTYIRKVEQSKALNHMDEPMIIISASGMCEAGRILHHLKNNIEDPRNLVLIVGYQAQHTLGRRIVERHPQVKIFGEHYTLNAQVEVMDEFSAHADANDLMDFVKAMHERRPLKKVIMVHGEDDQTLPFAQRVRETLDLDVVVPKYGDSIEL